MASFKLLVCELAAIMNLTHNERLSLTLKISHVNHPFASITNLLLWLSFLCVPVNARQVTSCMKGWSDLTMSPGLVGYLLDADWWLECLQVNLSPCS